MKKNFIILFLNLIIFKGYSQDSLEFSNILTLYQKHLSGVKSWECAMYPSCSEFAVRSFKNNNIFVASIATTDRLMRCGHDHSRYDHKKHGNGFKALDFPLNDNESKDFKETLNIGEKYISQTDSNSNEVIIVNELIGLGLNEQALSFIISKFIAAEIDSSVFFFIKSNILFNLKKFEDVIFSYNFEMNNNHRNDFRIIYIIANSYNSLENYSQAENYYKKIIDLSTDRNLSDKAKIHLSLILAKKDRFEESAYILSDISDSSNFHPYVINSMNSLDKIKHFQGKSPTVAAIMGIVPGGGYLYSGKKGTAIASFLLNGVLAYSVYEAFNKKLYGLCSLIGLFNMAFYIGSIKGGVSSVQKDNQRKKDQLFKNFSTFEY